MTDKEAAEVIRKLMTIGPLKRYERDLKYVVDRLDPPVGLISADKLSEWIPDLLSFSGHDGLRGLKTLHEWYASVEIELAGSGQRFKITVEETTPDVDEGGEVSDG